MCLPPTTTGSSSHRLLGSRRVPCREVITRLDFAPSTPSSRALQPERVLIELDDSAGRTHSVKTLGKRHTRCPDVSVFGLSERADLDGAGSARRSACCLCRFP